MTKRFLLCLTIAAFSVCSLSATEVKSTQDLTFYFPSFTSVDFRFANMPSVDDKRVDFCCEAAFTGQLLEKFVHTNIADDHVASGTVYQGYKCRANTGAFAWKDGKWFFMQKKDFHPKNAHYFMAFCQYLLMLDGKLQPMWERMRKNRTRYRALCEKDGRLCLVESNKVVTLEYFMKSLVNAHVTHAIYLDMGAGWNYAWYRDMQGIVRELFPESKKAKDFKYRTNWVVFRK